MNWVTWVTRVTWLTSVIRVTWVTRVTCVTWVTRVTWMTSFPCHRGNFSYFSRLSHLSYKEKHRLGCWEIWGIF